MASVQWLLSSRRYSNSIVAATGRGPLDTQPPTFHNKPMRCAACGTENSEQDRQCKQCGGRLPRPSRRREIQSVPSSWTSKRLDDQAFRLAIWGLIPPAGLILGPLALILGIRSIRHARAAGEDRFTPAMIGT